MWFNILQIHGINPFVTLGYCFSAVFHQAPCLKLFGCSLCLYVSVEREKMSAIILSSEQEFSQLMHNFMYVRHCLVIYMVKV